MWFSITCSVTNLDDSCRFLFVEVGVHQYNQNQEYGLFLFSGCRVYLAFVCTAMSDARVQPARQTSRVCPLQMCQRARNSFSEKPSRNEWEESKSPRKTYLTTKCIVAAGQEENVTCVYDKNVSVLNVGVLCPRPEGLAGRDLWSRTAHHREEENDGSNVSCLTCATVNIFRLLPTSFFSIFRWSFLQREIVTV